MKQIDLTELENEVIEHWFNEGIEYFSTENNGFDSPDPTNYETTILPEFQDILDDPLLCIYELGFSSISQYIGSKIC